MVEVVWRTHRHWAARTETLATEADSPSLQELWDLLIETFAGPGVAAVTDAYSDADPVGDLPTAARAAMDEIRIIGADRPGVRDAGMAVALLLDDEQQRELVSRFGPWSINVDVSDEQGDLFGIHDGRHLWMSLTTDELSKFRRSCEAAGLDIEARCEPYDYRPPPPVAPILAIVALAVIIAAVWGLVALIT